MTLRVCSGCRRHFGAESACPFCGAAAPPARARVAMPARLSRAAIFAALTGCYTSNPPPQGPPPPPDDQHQQTTFATPPPATGTGSISGTIRDSRNTTPLANVPVQLQSASQPSMEVRQANTDADGTYRFTNVPPGSYYLFWGHAHPRRGRPQRTVDVAEGQVIQLDLQIYAPPPSNVPMPYGAPPARRRIV